MTPEEIAAEVQIVNDTIDIAYPVQKPFGSYPSRYQVEHWVANGHTGNEIGADMIAALGVIPAPASNADGNGQRRYAFGGEYNIQTLFDNYYLDTTHKAPKPTAQQILGVVSSGGSSGPGPVKPPPDPIVIPPAPSSVTLATLDERVKFVERLLLENVEPRLGTLEAKVFPQSGGPTGQVGPGIF